MLVNMVVLVHLNENNFLWVQYIYFFDFLIKSKFKSNLSLNQLKLRFVRKKYLCYPFQHKYRQKNIVDLLAVSPSPSNILLVKSLE